MATKTSEKATPKKKAKKKSAAKGSRKKSTVSSAQWTFPKNTLEESIRIARAIEDKYAGNATKAEDLVKAVGFNKASDWRFLDLLKSANLYGLVSGTGQAATVNLEELGEDIVAPSGSNQRSKALLKSFRKVDEFRDVEQFYKNKKLPEDEYFENTLARNFNIQRDRVKVFKEVFIQNLDF